MKFGEKLAAQLTPEWRKQYIHYERLKEVIYDGLKRLPQKEVVPVSAVQHYLEEFEEEWFVCCDDELEKINTFFAEKLAEANRKLRKVKHELHAIEAMKTGRSLSAFLTGENAPLLRRRKQPAYWYNKKIGDMKLALSEFYLSLVLLQKYQNLNFTGFKKILKKFDKVFKVSSGRDYMVSEVQQAPFYTNKHIDQLIHEVENLFTRELEGGNRTKAMKRLRVPPLSEEARGGAVLYRVGLFSGIFLMATCAAVIAAFYTNHPHGKLIASQMYRGFFLFGLVTFLLAFNTYFWRKNGVNHVLIFELNPRKHLSYQQLLEVAGIVGVVWSLSLATYMFHEILGIESHIPSLALGCILAVFLLNPLRICYHRSRFWLLRILVWVHIFRKTSKTSLVFLISKRSSHSRVRKSNQEVKYYHR